MSYADIGETPSPLVTAYPVGRYGLHTLVCGNVGGEGTACGARGWVVCCSSTCGEVPTDQIVMTGLVIRTVTPFEDLRESSVFTFSYSIWLV